MIQRKVVKIEWEKTFGELLEKIGKEYSEESVTKVAVCGNEQFIDPVHDVPLDGPVGLCRSFGMNVCYYLSEPLEQQRSSTSVPNMFQILMASQKERVRPELIKATEGKPLRGDQLLYNCVINLFEQMRVGWSPDTVATIGKQVANQLTAALWYLDPHHDKFHERSISLPDAVAPLHGFNDWQKKKQKKPQIRASDLNGHIQSLSRTLSQPWMARSEYAELRSLVEGLNDAMYRYHQYLVKKCEEVKLAQEKSETVRSIEDNLEMRVCPASNDPVSSSYEPLVAHFAEKSNYEEVYIGDFAPEDRYSRRHWFDKLKLPFRTMMYRYPYGNHLGVVSFLWRIPDGDVDQTQVSRGEINIFVVHFATVLKFILDSKALLYSKNISHPYTGQQSSNPSQLQAEVLCNTSDEEGILGPL